jgi:hypothetical protein
VARTPAEYEDASSVELAFRCSDVGAEKAGCGAAWSERVPLPIRAALLARRLGTYTCPRCGSDAFAEFVVRVQKR